MDTLGRYQIISRLGAGTSGEVYQGYDPVLARSVAIKTPKSRDNLPENVHAFFNEARIASQFQHENIVLLFDVATDPLQNRDYLVMEYISGHSLSHYLKNTGLPLSIALDIVTKCGQALAYIHRKNIIHRDVKPSNIMVDVANNQVKLMDFGISQYQHEDLHQSKGSPRYMAPELYHRGRASVQSDIFALGAVLYHLLTGKSAFGGESATTVAYQVLYQTPPPLQDLNPACLPILQQIVDTALHKNAAKRYKTVDDLLMQLQQAQTILAEAESKAEAATHNAPVLRKDIWTKDFSVEQVEQMIQAGQTEIYRKNQRIIQEGDYSNALYVLLQGQVTIMKNNQVICTLDKGDCFGEMSYLSANPRTATVVAASNVLVCKVSPDLLRQCPSRHQLGFYQVFVKILLDRLHAGTQVIAQLQNQQTA